MQVWNVLHVVGWKYRTQKLRKKSPSAHHHITLSGYIFATKARIDNQKNLLHGSISSTRPHNAVNFNLLTAEIGWRVWGTRANFNGFRVLASLLQRRRSNEGRPNFARCLDVTCAGIHCIYIFGLLPPSGIPPGAKFTFRPSIAFSYIGSVTARHSSSARLPNFVAWYKEWNYGSFAPRHFQQRSPPIFWGRPSRWALSHILVTRWFRLWLAHQWAYTVNCRRFLY